MSNPVQSARRRILAAALPNVAFDGWTDALLRHAVQDAGLEPTMAARAFPGGVVDLAAFFVADADRRMVAALRKADLPALPVRQRIATAVRIRLEQNDAHREAIRRALGLFALPRHAGLGLKTLYRTVDAIWRAAGDRSTDYNFYTKRALLAGVYSATLVYWLNDNSEGHEETWAFLDRRIADVMRIERVKSRAIAAADRLPDPFGVLRRVRGVGEAAGLKAEAPGAEGKDG